MIIYDKENPDDTKTVYNEKIDYITHGTGDVFASIFVGSSMLGEDPSTSAKIAGEFTRKAIENTIQYPAHTYGVKFEMTIPYIYKLLNQYGKGYEF